MSVSRPVEVANWYEGESRSLEDHIATEVPLALTYNKRSHVVMMVSPADLEDFAIGCSDVLECGFPKKPHRFFAMLVHDDGEPRGFQLRDEA